MLGLKLNHVSKSGHSTALEYTKIYQRTKPYVTKQYAIET